MKSQQENQFLKYLEGGKQAPTVIKKREKVDIQKQLRAKYPNTLLPTHRAIRTLSAKQRRAVNQKGEI